MGTMMYGSSVCLATAILRLNESQKDDAERTGNVNKSKIQNSMLGQRKASTDKPRKQMWSACYEMRRSQYTIVCACGSQDDSEMAKIGAVKKRDGREQVKKKAVGRWR